MDHLDARELLELAAVEPGGLDRLMAGDTPSAIALAGHLAGCPECTEEFGRLRRASAVLREVIASQPRPELKAQTLAFVAAIGRPRGAAAGAPAGAGAPSTAGSAGMSAGSAAALADVEPEPTAVAPAETVRPKPVLVPSAAPVAETVHTPVPLHVRPAGRPRLAAWLAAAAALVIATAGVTGYAVSSTKDSAARQASQQLEGLAEVATWTVRLDAQPDVRRVVLTAPGSGSAATAAQVGTLLFSPGTQQIVVVADGIAAPPAGREYGCWVEVGGTRQRLGRMYLSGDVAYWVGDAAILATVQPGSVFGVSLADPANPATAAPPLLSGTLQST